MNLIALETLNALINLEILTLHWFVIVASVTYKTWYQFLLKLESIFDNKFLVFTRIMFDCNQHFEVYLTYICDETIDLELPVIKNTFACVVSIPYSPYPLSCDSMRYEVAITNKIPDQGFIDSLFALAKQWLSEMGYAFIGNPIIEKNVLKDDYYIDGLECYTLDRIYTI